MDLVSLSKASSTVSALRLLEAFMPFVPFMLLIVMLLVENRRVVTEGLVLSEEGALNGGQSLFGLGSKIHRANVPYEETATDL